MYSNKRQTKEYVNNETGMWLVFEDRVKCWIFRNEQGKTVGIINPDQKNVLVTISEVISSIKNKSGFICMLDEETNTYKRDKYMTLYEYEEKKISVDKFMTDSMLKVLKKANMNSQLFKHCLEIVLSDERDLCRHPDLIAKCRKSICDGNLEGRRCKHVKTEKIGKIISKTTRDGLRKGDVIDVDFTQNSITSDLEEETSWEFGEIKPQHLIIEGFSLKTAGVVGQSECKRTPSENVAKDLLVWQTVDEHSEEYTMEKQEMLAQEIIEHVLGCKVDIFVDNILKKRENKKCFLNKWIKRNMRIEQAIARIISKYNFSRGLYDSYCLKIVQWCKQNKKSHKRRNVDAFKSIWKKTNWKS
eukprot:UN29231